VFWISTVGCGGESGSGHDACNLSEGYLVERRLGCVREPFGIMTL
jgi:hypothetical protein